MRLRHHGPSIVIDAPAKLNLFLEVLQRRPDGYHDLETVMVAVDVFDTIRLTKAQGPSIRLEVSTVPGLRGASPLETVPTDDGNLCVLAARLLQAECGVAEGARIELLKRIPVQAGMGGGSSDAAAVLVGLNRLWGLNLASATLHQLAARLGSDLNFFIDSPDAAICRGRGEQVEPIAGIQTLWFAVAHPASGTSTGEVFRSLGEHRAEASADQFLHQLASGRTTEIADGLRNALQPAAVKLNSTIGKLLELMRSLSRHAPLMTGSGSACFALCGSRDEARRLVSQLKARHAGPAWVCRSCLFPEAA